MASTLKVAVQMDALETINVAGDSSLALMLEAQARGAQLFHYLPDQLDWVEDRVVATARPVELFWPPVDGQPHFRWLGEARQLDLAAEIDVVLLRQDPPFDMAYITSTHLLERARDAGVLVVNDPTSVRNAPEKLFVLNYADLMPPTLVTRSLAAAQAFRRKHREVVVKPLYGNAGAALFHVPEGDSNLPALVVYPAALNPETLFEPAERKAQAEAEKWARAQGMRYVVTGAVNEWRYKVGVDGEPAVGLMLQVKDLSRDLVVYSAAGGRTGGSREALAAVGQRLAAELVSGIRVDPAGRPTTAQ